MTTRAITKPLLAAACTTLLLPGLAAAKVSAEEAAKLGKESTWQFDWSNPIGLLGKSEPKKPEDRRGRLQRLAGDVLNKGEGDDPGPIMPRLVKPESAPVPETPAQPLRRTIGSP